MGGGNTNLQSSPSNNQGGVHINGELRSIGAQNDSDYYNPNLWARILGRVNETDVEIDGIMSKALNDSGAMILIMSKDYCYECRYEIQPLEHLVPIEGSGGASVPYLGYVECTFLASILLIGKFSCSLAVPPPNTIKEYQYR